jgi:NTP pyrophosphatase (non-canonical NTP hydrolase)
MTQILDIDAITAQLREFALERDWQKFHSPKNLSMALSVEASELVEIFQWLSEAESLQPNQQQQLAIRHEIADVMLYLLRISDILNIDIQQALEEKIALNQQRYPADKVKGSAKKYTEYL